MVGIDTLVKVAKGVFDNCPADEARNSFVIPDWLQKMVDKRQLNQLDPVEGKAFRFEPLVSDQQVSRGMLGDIVERVFDGSAEAVMLSLFDVAELDDAALKSLRKAFNQKLKEKSNE